LTAIDISPISGFPEWLPDKRIVEQRILDVIRQSYELFGFTPIETPSVERWPVLTAKGGIQRQVFSVGRPNVEDATEQELGLHFDLTVPLARYVASRSNDLTFPFRRHQIQKVWRGERAQRGRFREFYQCDIDIIGSETLDLLYDAEIARVIGVVFDTLGVGDIKVHISNRKILTSLAGAFDIDSSSIATLLRLIDKASRDGATAAAALLLEEGFAADVASAFERLLDASDLAIARAVLADAGAELSGVDELEQVYDAALALGMPASQIEVDLSIARGLDYYTGTVYETFVTGHEQWGSVCSGGRYEDLAGYFTDRRLPGVGVSIGATRLLDLLTQSGIMPLGAKTPTKVLVTAQDRASYLPRYLEFAASLRLAGIASEVYLQPRKLGDQLKYAGDLGIPLVLIAGSAELSRDCVQLRNMDDGQQIELPISELVPETERLLRALDSA
jgi:histidyl-tRNA synthetase